MNPTGGRLPAALAIRVRNFSNIAHIEIENKDIGPGDMSELS
jgi:hypothetical protein